jgi:hypothetical protein
MPAFKSTAKSPEIHYVTVIKEENQNTSNSGDSCKPVTYM